MGCCSGLMGLLFVGVSTVAWIVGIAVFVLAGAGL
jgi:predicted metal-binding membrane protein